MAKMEIKLAWAQKMAAKEALVVRLLVNQKASCKSEDTCSHAVVLGTDRREVQSAGFFEQGTAGRGERQMTAVMAEAVGGLVGTQVTAGSWKRGWRESATCSG